MLLQNIESFYLALRIANTKKAEVMMMSTQDKSIVTLIFAFALFFLFADLRAQEIPYPAWPDWESNKSGRSTGLGLADINGDGWKDIVIANGNDMARQHLVVYYNQGDGTFPIDPDWESDDIDYNGHLAVGDIDNDGWIDVAVSVYIGANGFSQPGKVKVYYNQEGELEANPSFESYPFYTFSCALGDADGDGDLDLATTGGEPYSQIYDEGKIFMNENGTFDSIPIWMTDGEFGSLDVDFGDMDQNGYMDVVFSSEETTNFIYLANQSGQITTDFSWHSEEEDNYINSLDIGKTGASELMSVVMTGNDQLGGDGEVRQYSFDGEFPYSSSASWSSEPFGYGSGILLSDVNIDGITDLIYGGWWLPVNIALGLDEGFEMDPSYISSTKSVVEAIQIADLDRDDINVTSETFFPEEGIGSVVYLNKQLIENILDVRRNDVELADSLFCYVPNKNWVSFKDDIQAGDLIEIEYEYSHDGDMVVSNWDANRGNYIFYNTLITAVDEQLVNEVLVIAPNPARDFISLKSAVFSRQCSVLQILDLRGKLMIEEVVARSADRVIINIQDLPSGTYLCNLQTNQGIFTKKLVVVK